MFPDGVRNWNILLGSACAVAGKATQAAAAISVTVAALNVFICVMRQVDTARGATDPNSAGLDLRGDAVEQLTQTGAELGEMVVVGVVENSGLQRSGERREPVAVQ
jgi:hypothetical protein